MFEIVGLPKGSEEVKVTYFRLNLIVPRIAEYLAMDSNGRLYWYSMLPTAEDKRSMWIHPDGCNYQLIATFNYKGDWKDSLMEIPK